MQYNRVLTIAGSDSGGGAGIQADIKTISACGCFATTAITAVTAQNTIGVFDVHPIPVNIIKNQINAVMTDMGTDAIKIGMLHSSEVICGIHECLEPFAIKNIVLDPVMVSTSGHTLMQDDAIETLKSELLYNVRVITPNIPEAEILLGRKITGQDELPRAAQDLSAGRKVSVLLKAGHLSEKQLTDIFYNAETDEILELCSMRLETPNTHGTGCTLSSAFAAFLAKGFPLNIAAQKAKEYINAAIIHGAGYQVGKGHGPVHFFFRFWK
jgi:hydroxymethylpyrimidine/phosphomethylpyrimidine kinase